MSLKATVLFDQPQRELASVLRSRMSEASEVRVVVGFATVDGLALLSPALLSDPAKLKSLVVGAGTFRAFEALDSLMRIGVPVGNLRVHLGHTRPWGANPQFFHKYHPMLHSKIYLLDMPGGHSAVVLGSHNATAFALGGLNGEASVLLEGESAHPEIEKVRQHMATAGAQSTPYDPSMKAAYTWWAEQFLEGLRRKVDDVPKDFDGKRTVVMLAVQGQDGVPQTGDVIYFEMPKNITALTRLQADVHIYVFATSLAGPYEGLRRLDEAVVKLRCVTQGLVLKGRGEELDTDWHMPDRRLPELLRATPPFRPSPASDVQQVLVVAASHLDARFEYLFSPARTDWTPVYSERGDIRIDPEAADLLAGLNLDPPEHLEWKRVAALTPRERGGRKKRLVAEQELGPDARSYVLFSQRRLRLDSKEADHDGQ